MLGALITILVVAIVIGLIYWIVDVIPVPQPLNKFVKIACMVIGCLAVIIVLLGLVGYDTGLPLRR